jgi:flavin-dependent dehydrogenase
LTAPVDVVVVGAGPAGCATAIALAARRSVLVVDGGATPVARPVESLPAAGRRVLVDLGIALDDLDDACLPHHVRASRFGSSRLDEADALADPDGCGWLLDRPAFDRRLRAETVRAGASVLRPARACEMRREPGGWSVSVQVKGVLREIKARFAVVAAGRATALTRSFRQTPRAGVARDRLVCASIIAPLRSRVAGTSYVESAPDGWWYTAPQPDGHRLLAFHSDGDLPAVAAVRGGRLAEQVATSPTLRDIAADCDLGAATAPRFRVAGSRCHPPAGKGWIAVGDAATTFDPLSSQGLFNALVTGIRAADAIDRHLDGDSAGTAAYALEVNAIWAAYCLHRAAYYGLERRWLDRPFWQRRHAGP